MTPRKHFNPVTAAAAYAASQRGDTWKDARRERAERLKLPAGYLTATETLDVQSNTTSEREPASSLQSGTDCIRVDVELTRMCVIGFKHYPQFQRWLVLHDATRQTGKQGFTFAELSTRCRQLGVKGCDTYTRRIIRKGIGTYWHYDPRTDTIYPIGYVALCKWAVQYAYDLGLHDLYLYGNHPGQRRDMYISVSGAGADFEGACLAAWYGAHGCPTISRFTLSALLGRDARSIRRMEKRACIRITYNEAQTTDPAAVPLKANGELRGDVIPHDGVWTWRLPNTYQPRMTRQHPKRGQGRKAACWFKHWLSSNRLPGDHGAEVAESFRDLGKLNRIARSYCETDRALQASRRRGYDGVLYVATLGRNRGMVWAVDAEYHDI